MRSATKQITELGQKHDREHIQRESQIQQMNNSVQQMMEETQQATAEVEQAAAKQILSDQKMKLDAFIAAHKTETFESKKRERQLQVELWAVQKTSLGIIDDARKAGKAEAEKEHEEEVTELQGKLYTEINKRQKLIETQQQAAEAISSLTHDLDIVRNKVVQADEAASSAHATSTEQQRIADNARAEVTELERQAKKSVESSISNVVKLLGGAGVTKFLDRRGLDKLSTSSAVVENENGRARKDLKRAATICAQGIVKALAGDDSEERQNLIASWLREGLDKTTGEGAELRIGEVSTEIKNIINAWRHAASLGDTSLQTQLLSLAIGGGMTQTNLRNFFSLTLPINQGDDILVLQGTGHLRNWRRGVCTGVTDDDDGNAMYAVAPVVIVGRPCSRRTCDLETGVPSTRVQHADSLTCSEHQTKTASHHASSVHAGARVPRRLREGWTRTSGERDNIIATFTTSKSTRTRCLLFSVHTQPNLSADSVRIPTQTSGLMEAWRRPDAKKFGTYWTACLSC